MSAVQPPAGCARGPGTGPAAARCPSCRARVRPADTWCPQCLTSLVAPLSASPVDPVPAIDPPVDLPARFDLPAGSVDDDPVRLREDLDRHGRAARFVVAGVAGALVLGLVLGGLTVLGLLV